MILNQTTKLTLTIIGAGRVGQTLGHLFVQSGLVDLKYVVDLDWSTAQQAVEFIGAGKPLGAPLGLEPTHLYFLAVEDTHIASVADQLSLQLDLSQSIIFHASGALTSEILSVTGGSVASIHPICSFATPQLSVINFDGTYCGVEGDLIALATLKPLFTRIGGKCIDIEASQKTIYHAGAVFASNFMPLMIESAIQCYLKAGLTRPVAMELVEPLAKNTLDNVFKVGPKCAMTGPAVRGDNKVIENHKNELSHFLPAEERLYSFLTNELKKLVENS